MSERTVSLTPGKRVLFLTKDPELIRRQLSRELDLRMEDLRGDDIIVVSNREPYLHVHNNDAIEVRGRPTSSGAMAIRLT